MTLTYFNTTKIHIFAKFYMYFIDNLKKNVQKCVFLVRKF